MESVTEREDITIARDGHVLAAWHYPPSSTDLTDADGRAPAVILAHGLGFTRDCGLDSYAQAFAQAGIHAVVFDYSGFGDSEGTPRDVVNVDSQLRDYECAITATRALDGVAPKRVALWGTSYAGGIVVAAAARDGEIAAVVSQCPNLDNLATALFLVRNTPPLHGAWLVSGVRRDGVRALRKREPFYVRAMGPEGSGSAYPSDDIWARLQHLAGPTWNNRIGLRDFLRLPVFRAVSYLDRLPCRIQFIACELDDLTPVAPTLAAAKKLGDKADLYRVQAGHFDVYVEPFLAPAVAAQTKFLVGELRAPVPAR